MKKILEFIKSRKSVRNTCKLLEGLRQHKQGLEVPTLEAEEYVGKFKKPGVKEQPVCDGVVFELHHCRCECRSSGLFLFDAQYHLILALKDPASMTTNGLASIGFDVDRRWRKIVVKQIQGRRFGEEAYKDSSSATSNLLSRQAGILRSIRWEKLLIKVLADWAHKRGFKRIEVQKAKHNQYWRTPLDSNKEHNERLKMHYDITPQRMGFRESSPTARYWSRNLPITTA